MLIDYLCAALALKVGALKRENHAVTAIEYALIASLVAVVIVVAVKSIGTKLPEIFNQVSTELSPPTRHAGLEPASIAPRICIERALLHQAVNYPM